MTPERLPEDQPTEVLADPSPRRGWIRWLLASEELPDDAEARGPMPRPRSWLARLLASEQLPEEPTEAGGPAPSGGGVSLRWLLRGERLDDVEADHPTQDSGGRPAE